MTPEGPGGPRTARATRRPKALAVVLTGADRERLRAVRRALAARFPGRAVSDGDALRFGLAVAAEYGRGRDASPEQAAQRFAVVLARGAD